jgi:hypothetical protein
MTLQKAKSIARHLGLTLRQLRSSIRTRARFQRALSIMEVEMEVLMFFVVWIGWSILNGVLASRRGHSPGGPVAVSLIISPLIVTLILLCMRKRMPAIVRQARENVERERLEAYFRKQQV